MSRIIAIDYGRRRTGVAASDILRITVNALGTFTPNDTKKFLQKYLQNEQVETIVVGNPQNLDGSPSQISPAATQFAAELRKLFPQIKVEQYDERFTSKMAMQAMIMGGATRNQRRNKPLIDQISACIILQSYLDYCQNMLKNVKP
jgi:putative Holliday junction resolvase